MEARSHCSGISAAADSTSPVFLCLQSPDCISFFFLGSVFSYHFVSTCKLMTVGIHIPFTINMTFLCMPAVSSWARYILVFRLLSFHGRQGDASLQPFLSLTTFLCWAYPMCFLCLAALCPGVIHGSPNSLPAPSVRGIRGTILPLPRGWGRITPLSSSFCGSRLVLLDNLVSYREYLMDSLVADIFVHIDTA